MGFCFVFSYGLYRDLCRAPLREAENAGGDTAERDAFAAVFFRELQAGGIAGREQLFVLCRQPLVHDGTDGVNHVFARQVIRRRDFRLPGRLLVSLLLHEFGAFVAKTQSRESVDAVVDTAVKRLKAAEHL